MALELDERDEACLDGHEGPALQWAMQLLTRVADYTGAHRLVDVTKAHVVGSYHSGLGNLQLIQRLVEAGARVVIPTTLNASGTDLDAPRRTHDAEYQANCAVVRAYQQMGCLAELTCAPYYLPVRPQAGENIAWAESNAVVFANSVIGARTNMTCQYLDLAAALTGRIPQSGLYVTENRAGNIVLQLDFIPDHWLEEGAFYQLLGYVLGRQAGGEIPVIANLPRSATEDQLRSLGAAAAAAGQVNMFHAVGVTPEAPTLQAALHGQVPTKTLVIGHREILSAKTSLQSWQGSVTAVCLGTPHFSLTEFEQLLALIAGRGVSKSSRLVVSTSRYIRGELEQKNMLAPLLESGVELVVDSCTYYGKVLGDIGGAVMTNSAKWAYYGPGNLGIGVVFARLTDCVETAVRGKVTIDESFWA